jgi:hypothetical protein
MGWQAIANRPLTPSLFLNGKKGFSGIAQVIESNLGSPLTEKQMKQITAWLEDRCKNVEV